jgi:surface antigen
MTFPLLRATAIRLTAAVSVTALIAGCAGDPGPRTTMGAAGGALLGGSIGALTGSGSAGNIVAGAVIGGLVGGIIGNALDEEDRRRAYAAEMQALEYGGPGTPVSWEGRQGRGTIVPGPYHSRGSYQRCRDYSHTIYIGGRPQVARGVACRNPDGTWTQIS